MVQSSLERYDRLYKIWRHFDLITSVFAVSGLIIAIIDVSPSMEQFQKVYYFLSRMRF